MKLTPEEKAEKLARDQLRSAINKCKMQFSIGHIKTWGQLFSVFGYDQTKNWTPNQLQQTLTYNEFKEWCSDREIELSTHFWLKRNPIQLPSNKDEGLIETSTTGNDIAEGLHPTLSEAIRLSKEPKATFDVQAEMAAAEYAKRLPNLRRRKAFLFWDQKKAIVQIIDNIIQGLPATYLIAGTGAGKTFTIADVLCWLIETKWTEGKTYTPWPIVYVTKASVIEQTKRVLEQYYGITEDEVLVTNYDQLRATFGTRFVKEELYIEDGVEHISWKWKGNLKPVVIVWDEGHSLKNDTSTQSKIGLSYSEESDKLPGQTTFQLFSSASPGTKVSEFKAFCCATKIPYTYGITKDAPLTAAHWRDFAENIASDYGKSDIIPEQHSPAAIERLMNYMEKYIVRVKGIRWQFKGINRTEMIQFETEAGRKEYDNALETFMQEKAEIEASDMSTGQATINILAQFTIFLKAAESNTDRVNIITRRMHYNVQEGFAAVCAVRNKITICKCVKILIERYGVKRNQISLIWGGAPIATKKQKVKASMLKNKELMTILAAQGITMEDLDMDDIESSDEMELYPKEWRLGPQNAKQRQEEIDRFQKGISLYCFYTFRAGGVGLSLHHTDEWTKEKVRHKESGYAVEEDIPSIPTRPRRNIVSPTWSAIELVQGVGRCPRRTSLSNTEQVMLFFVGTLEERQARVVSMKLHCLTKVVRNPGESWEDLILGRKGMTDEQVERAHLVDAMDRKENDDSEDKIDGIQIEDDEEEE